MDTSKRILPEHEAFFPNLFSSGYAKTSEIDCFYNCIAWAAGEENTETWWDPFAIGNGYYWPNELERNADVETFVRLYRMKGGFEPSENTSTDFEPGIEKIALYVNSENEVTHAARQKDNGAWTSKLGELEDIEHQKVDALFGKAPAYGTLAKILKRPSKK